VKLDQHENHSCQPLRRRNPDFCCRNGSAGLGCKTEGKNRDILLAA
jgi:hypothetical protein